MAEKDHRITHLTVLWVKAPVPQIPEMAYSYGFCRQMSHAACMAQDCTVQWFDVSPTDRLEAFPFRRLGTALLLVTEPEIVLTVAGLSALLCALSLERPACGPVYNDTKYPNQQAAIPWIYHNLSTLEEVAAAEAPDPEERSTRVRNLDPACILYHPAALNNLPPDTMIGLIRNALDETGAVIPNAFVHRFVHYYQSERAELIDLIPEHTGTILDVGCAMGGYGKAVRERFPQIRLTGVELNRTLAEKASAHYDELIVSPIESVELPGGYDLINCGDVIEHLHDPWAMLEIYYRLLKPGGYLVMGLPNAGHWSIVKDLAAGRFQYIPAGLLCVTHIRWFTESGIREALETSGFVIETLRKQKALPTPQGAAFVDDLCAGGYGDRDSLLTHAFVIRAAKPQEGDIR